MNYNSFIGPETINCEYKEFTFNNCNLEIDYQVAEELILSSEWIFNDYVLKNLSKYFKMYIPKYSSAFLDKYSECNTGELYIGINDDGIIQGIPYQGTLKQSFIRKKIKYYFNKFVMTENKSLNFDDHLKIELIPINYKEHKTEKHCNEYTKYLKQLEIMKKKEEKNRAIYLKWNELHSRYVQKLVDLFNNPSTRYELLNYVLYKEPKNPIIKLLKSDYQLQPKTHDEINILKDDYSSPYFWVCRWKDTMINFIRSIKPILHRPELENCMFPYNILLKATPMIPWWMNHNDGMNLYIIKITFIKPQDKIPIYYLDVFNKVNRCYRTSKLMVNYRDKFTEPKLVLSPCCIPL